MRRGRVLGGPSVRAARGGDLSLPWLPRRVVRGGQRGTDHGRCGRAGHRCLGLDGLFQGRSGSRGRSRRPQNRGRSLPAPPTSRPALPDAAAGTAPRRSATQMRAPTVPVCRVAERSAAATHPAATAATPRLLDRRQPPRAHDHLRAPDQSEVVHSPMETAPGFGQLTCDPTGSLGRPR
jgi:hypothetical protein